MSTTNLYHDLLNYKYSVKILRILKTDVKFKENAKILYHLQEAAQVKFSLNVVIFWQE